MRYLSTRIAVASSLTFLVVWLASSLVLAWDTDAAGAPARAAFSRTAWTIELPALGFIGLMIMGMAHHFVPLFSGRELRSRRAGVGQVGVAVSAVVLDLAHPSLEAVAKGLWLVAAVSFVVLILATLRQPASAVRVQDRRPELRRVDRHAIPMTAAAILYLVAASVGFFLASPQGRPLWPAAAPYWFSYLHLYTLGFIALMVFGVGFHLFPRFLDAAPPLAGVRAVMVLALAGPVGVAGTMPLLGRPGGGTLFAAFALFEATAAVLFALLVVDLWRRSPKRRMASLFNVVGVLWLGLGVGLGALMGLAPAAYLGWAPAHGWINLLGFAGFQILGVTHEVLPPYASRGLRAIRAATRVHLLLAVLGLGLVVSAQDAVLRGDLSLGGTLSRVGFALLLAMSLSYSAGTVSTLRDIARGRAPS